MTIIGITGTDGAGKGVVVDYLIEQKKFSHHSARTLWVDEIEKRDEPVDREHMRLIANDLRRLHGNDYFIAESIRRAREADEKYVVLESLRALAEVETLKREGGVLLAVDADQRLRFERIQERASASDDISFDEFVAHEALEMNDPDPNGMQKAKVMEMADYTLLNEGTLEELHAQIEDVLRKIGI